MIYKFSDIEVNTDNRQLIKNHQLMKVEPLIFDLLVCFINNPNRVFNRDELLEQVWGGRIVSDSSISTAIKGLRKAIGDSGKNQQYVQTVHGKGFRFCSDITSSTANAQPVKESSIIILPLQLLIENQQLVDLAEDLVANLKVILSRIPLLRISAQASQYQHQETRPTARQVFEQVGANYIIDGTATIRNDRFQLNIHLADGPTGLNLWSQRFDLHNEDENVTESLTNQIVSKLEPQINRAVYKSVLSSDNEDSARSLYLRASGLLSIQGWNKDTFSTAAELLRKSEDRDPSLALAPAYLSLVLALGHRVGILDETEDAIDGAVQAVERALTLDNMDSTVLGFTGCALVDIGKMTRGIPLLKKAIQLNVTNAQAWAALGSAKLFQGELTEAIENLTHGIAMSPLDSRLSIWRTLLALAYLQTGDLILAKEQAQLACEEDDKAHIPRVALATVYFVMKNLTACKDAMQDAYRIKSNLTDKEVFSLVGNKLGHQIRML